jgi:hypothetical protein
MAGVSASTIAKLSHNEYVSLEILERICRPAGYFSGNLKQSWDISVAA